MRDGRCTEFLHDVFTAENDEKAWEYYLAMVANPMTEKLGSFDEFKRKLNGIDTKPIKKPVQADEPVNIKAVVAKSQAILAGFKPV